ncbi:MAG: MFS transporter [Chloroflexota bacterium]
MSLATPDATGARPRSGSLWRNGSFMKLWTAETISQFGSQVSLLAIPLVAIVVLGANAFEVALLSTVEFLPFILFSLPAGAWVDRLRRRPILIAGDLGRAVSLASVPIAYALGVLSVPQLLVVGFVNGTLTVFFDVAYQSYLPSIVERDRILEGNSKLEVTRTLAQSAGPALAGGLIGLVTAPVAIVMDAISFLGSGLFVWLIRRPEAAPDQHLDEHGRPRQGLRREVADGLRYVLGNRYLRSIAACTGSANLFTNLAMATYLLYVVRVLGLDAAQIGVVFGLGNVAALFGAVLAERFGRWFGVGPTIVASAFTSGVALVLVPLAPVSSPIPLLLISGAVSAVSNVVYNITQVSFRQAITPTAMQGRMNATMRFIVWGTIPIGTILGGILATSLGLHETLWIGSLLGLLPFLFVLLSPVRGLHAMPEPVGDSAPAVSDPGPADLEVAGLPE